MKSYNEIIMDHMISQGITLNDIFNCYSNQIVPSGDDSAKAYANIKAMKNKLKPINMPKKSPSTIYNKKENIFSPKKTNTKLSNDFLSVK